MNLKIRHIILYSLILMFHAKGQSQSNSFGNTFVHRNGECVIFGMHDFDNGSMGVQPGIIGTERDKGIGQYGIIGFSEDTPGWKGIGDDSFVDGYVKKYGENPFVFPIGDNGKYRPIAISGGNETTAAYFKADPATAITSDLFGGNYNALPEGGPFPQSSKYESIINISDLEYWDIDGSDPTRITLTWDIFSEIERISNNDLDKLSILGWDGASWQIVPSRVDLLYLNSTRSMPIYNGGISNKIKGSISTVTDIIPDTYLAYTFGSVASGSIGDYVWEDLNRDGKQEVGEPGIPDVPVQLFDMNDSLLMTTMSDANGLYVFAGVPAGIYYLKFNADNTYAATIPNQGIAALNSDISFNNTTAPFQLDINESDFSIDAGFYRTGSIGDFVWMDQNNDGIQDEFEIGMNGVRVELLNANDKTTAATVTNINGFYAFTNLPPGYYKIKVVPPVGSSIGPYKAILNDEIDSDISPIDGKSDLIQLLSGQEIKSVDAALSSECLFTAELDITAPECGTADGFIAVNIDGDTGPYHFEWNTGDTTPFLGNIDTGYYTLIISDRFNCLRTFEIDVTYSIGCEMICAEIDAQVFLEGPYNYVSQKMNTRLNELGYLPGQRPVTFLGKYTPAGNPYDERPWYINGIEGMDYESQSVAENNLYYPVEAVDWVLVSLRSMEDAEYEACTRAALLLDDGSISFVNDDCCLVNPFKEYFITIEHRNHLVVMTPTPQPVVNGTISFDFRIQDSYRRLFGAGQKQIAPGVFAMYAANGDQYLSLESSGDINVSDMSEWLKENGQHSSYYRQDYDLNGDANVQDKGIYLRNIGIFTDVPKGN